MHTIVGSIRTRSRNLLAQSGEKWGEHKKERAKLLFDLYPQMKEAYSLICKVRDIFKRKLTVDEARTKLHAGTRRSVHAHSEKSSLQEIVSNQGKMRC